MEISSSRRAQPPWIKRRGKRAPASQTMQGGLCLVGQISLPVAPTRPGVLDPLHGDAIRAPDDFLSHCTLHSTPPSPSSPRRSLRPMAWSQSTTCKGRQGVPGQTPFPHCTRPPRSLPRQTPFPVAPTRPGVRQDKLPFPHAICSVAACTADTV